MELDTTLSRLPIQAIHARELRYASPKAIARELTKLFFYLGPPDHLYANDTSRRLIIKVLKYIADNMSHTIKIKKSRYINHQIYNLRDFQTRLLSWLNENLAIPWRFGIQECAGYLTRHPLDLTSSECLREPLPISELESMVQDALLVFSCAKSRVPASCQDDNTNGTESSSCLQGDSHAPITAVSTATRVDDDIIVIDEDAHGIQDSSGLQGDSHTPITPLVSIIPERIIYHDGIQFGGRSITTGSTANESIARAGLEVIKTPGKGQCFFHCVRNHFIEFNRHSDAHSIEEMRNDLVNYLIFDERGKHFKEACMTGIDVSMLRRMGSSNRSTWPTAECFFAISQLYSLKVTVFTESEFTNTQGDVVEYHQIYEFWPHTLAEGPDYPPVPSADWLCVKYSNEHFELVLPKNARKAATKKRKRGPIESATTSDTAHGLPQDPTTFRSCRCTGQCRTRSCICFRENRRCNVNCHLLNIGICENRNL